MKRLLSFNADAIINTEIINYYGIKYCGKCEIGKLDYKSSHAIKQALNHSVREKFPEADKVIASQYVSCIIKYVMHLEPEIAEILTQDEDSVAIYMGVVGALRRNFINEFSEIMIGSEEICIIVVNKLLERLERLFFGK